MRTLNELDKSILREQCEFPENISAVNDVSDHIALEGFSVEFAFLDRRGYHFFTTREWWESRKAAAV